MPEIDDLFERGQTVWFDYCRRSFIASGELESIIKAGVRGVISNPAIFSRAVNGSSDYDEDIRRLAELNRSVEEIYEELFFDDIARVADMLSPIYESTQGVDGYVCIDILPTLAHNTLGSIAEAQRIFHAVGRPNVMIKIAATPEGIHAMEELILKGIPVNASLIFDPDQYVAVSHAYLRGLERRLADTGHINDIASVASFFVSRLDTVVDQALSAKKHRHLSGKTAIAQAKIVYATFQRVFGDTRWKKLEDSGARTQRLLWSSTSTKNPTYPDTYYLDHLIQPHTICALSPSSLNAFLDHGTQDTKPEDKTAAAKSLMMQLKDAGIDLKTIGSNLLDGGLKIYAKAFESLMAGIGRKYKRLMTDHMDTIAHLGDYQAEVALLLKDIKDQDIMGRIWRHDHTVWKQTPQEIINRLGWLHIPEKMREMLGGINALVDELRREGYTHALLMGMGGSSLAPEVFRYTYGVKADYLDVSVLDSTDSAVLIRFTKRVQSRKTLFIASTKSGGTVETLSFVKYFYNLKMNDPTEKNPGDHFIAITDPGSGLETLAERLHFRKTFLNDPYIGGRYSALSYFGLVPAALMGVDVPVILHRALIMANNNESCNDAIHGDNTGAWLGAIMGQLADTGRDKLTLILSPPIRHFGSWLEQLIAESTGKDGKGILPVDGEALLDPDCYLKDRLFIYLRLYGDNTYDTQFQRLIRAGHPGIQINLRDTLSLGGEFFRWEMATAVSGYRLGINPFDQPNVESAKVLARRMLTVYQKDGKLPEFAPALISDGLTVYTDLSVKSPEEALNQFLSQAHIGEKNSGCGYVALQAYLTPSREYDEMLHQLRTLIQKRTKMATTVGYGPRFLHSTGQLHKGDAGRGLFIQFTGTVSQDVPIPDETGKRVSSMTFGTLQSAQALGDRQALIDAGRKVIRFQLEENGLNGLKRLIDRFKKIRF